MQKVLKLFKEEGETPLETIERFRRENPDYKKEKMTYAGRLDPMAEGILLVLVGEECKNKEKYLGLDKEYEFEILWGFKTDTYDILGLSKKGEKKLSVEEKKKKILKNFSFLEGKFKQKYPPYSSMTVKGKQLHQWAREGKLDEIKIPEKKVEIYEMNFLGNREISGNKLFAEIKKRISKVQGNFRQKEILEKWKKNFENNLKDSFLVSKFRVKCSSGTYVRGIVNELGNKIGEGALAFNIKRTKLGDLIK